MVNDILTSAARRAAARKALPGVAVGTNRVDVYPTTSAACWLCPSVRPRAFIQS